MEVAPVTTESELEPAGPDNSAGPPAAPTPGPSQPQAVESEALAAQGLASIIIDASLAEPEPQPQPEPQPVAEPAPDTGQSLSEADSLSFDLAAADRFAAAYRPSWEPPAPAAALNTAGKPISQRPSQRPEAAAGVVGADETLTPLRLQAARRRTMLLFGGSVAGFLLLTYVAISMSSSSAPPRGAPVPAAKRAPEERPPAAAPRAAEPEASALVNPTPAIAPAVIAVEAAPAAAEAVPAAPEAAPPAPVAAEAAPTPTAAAVPETRRIRVTTVPQDARLFVDQVAVSNPLDTQLAVGEVHGLEARAEGYVSATQALRVSREARIKLTLKRAPRPATPKPQAVASPPARSKLARPTRAAAAAPTKRATATQPEKPKAKKGAGFVADSPY